MDPLHNPLQRWVSTQTIFTSVNQTAYTSLGPRFMWPIVILNRYSGDSAGPHSLTQNLRKSAPEAVLSNVTAAHGFMSIQKKYF